LFLFFLGPTRAARNSYAEPVSLPFALWTTTESARQGGIRGRCVSVCVPGFVFSLRVCSVLTLFNIFRSAFGIVITISKYQCDREERAVLRVTAAMDVTNVLVYQLS